jgi:hypothetical protein
MPNTSNRRLIISLVRPFRDDADEVPTKEEMEHEYNAAVARAATLKTAFTHAFPGVPELSEAVRNFAMFQERVFVARGVEEKHFEWAKHAKTCGLIDSYLVDYDPLDGVQQETTTHSCESEAPYSEHYKGYPFEPVDIAEAYNLDFNEGNVVKYLLRWRKKDGIKDLRKARYYIERLISLEERRLREAGE